MWIPTKEVSRLWKYHHGTIIVVSGICGFLIGCASNPCVWRKVCVELASTMSWRLMRLSWAFRVNCGPAQVEQSNIVATRH